MAQDTKAESNSAAPAEFTEVDKKKARPGSRRLRKPGSAATTITRSSATSPAWASGPTRWKRASCRSGRLAVQRRQAGGKKPGMMDNLKRSMAGKDHKKALLNAAYLVAKDPTSTAALDGLLKNAAKGGFYETLKWVTDRVFESLRKDKKPNLGRFKVFRHTLAEVGQQCTDVGQVALAAHFYEQAVISLEYLLARNPADSVLRDEQRDLSGKLTIAKGKYGEADSFRDSIQDADAQKLLHDQGRAKQGDQTVDALIAAAKLAYEAAPETPTTISAYVDTLIRRDREDEEREAIAVLEKTYAATKNYTWKQRADDIRMRQMQRETRRAIAKARKTGDAEDKRTARVAATRQIRGEAEIYRERVANYPTDLRMRFKLGRALFTAREWDEAIPVLQAAQAEPRSREQAQMLIGRCFLEKKAYAQAREVLREALAGRESASDDGSKELLYWLGRAHEGGGEVEPAKEAYGKLLRMDYNYANGDARKRLEALG